MGKLKYLTQRILKMNYKQFFKTIKNVGNKTNRNKVEIFIDVIKCGIKYQAGYIEKQ